MKVHSSVGFVVLFLAFLVIISGCDVAKKVLPQKCPAACDDTDACTQEKCNAETDFTCQHELIYNCDGNKICEDGEYLSSTDCPNCDDSNVCTRDTYAYNTSSCGHEPIDNCCGNSACEAGENFFKCPLDCKSCDDLNTCTEDTYNYGTQKCEHEPFFPCCGNTRCEMNEKFATCPTDCAPSKDDQIGLCGSNESCITGLATRFREPQICKNIITHTGTDDCYSALAISLNRSVLCSSVIEDAKIHSCQEEYAVYFSDVRSCPLEKPNNCFERLAIKLGNEQICNNLIEQFVSTRNDFVIKCKAVVRKDLLTCKEIGETWIADKCYTDLAVMFKNANICSAVILDKETCEFYVEDAILG